VPDPGALGRDEVAAARAAARIGTQFCNRYSCPTEGCGYGATSPGQTLITLICNKATTAACTLVQTSHFIAWGGGE